MEGLTEGRVIHYVLTDDYGNAGQHRAAIVVRVFPGLQGKCNLTVILDGWNDSPPRTATEPVRFAYPTSVPFDGEGKRPGTWHWIEGSPGSAPRVEEKIDTKIAG